MDRRILSLMNLFTAFGRIQNDAWNSLSARDGKVVSSLKSREIKAMMNIYLREETGEAALTLNQLADLLAMKKAAASILISALSQKKLITRKVDESNRRYIRIALTNSGRRLGDAVAGHAAHRMEEIFAELQNAGATQTEINSFIATANLIYQLCMKRPEAQQ